MRNRFVYAIENHPNDSMVRMDSDGIVQTLSSRMGTGGNNTPFVLIEEFRTKHMTPVSVAENSCVNAVFTDGTISPTLCARAGTGGNQLPLICLRIDDETK